MFPIECSSPLHLVPLSRKIHRNKVQNKKRALELFKKIKIYKENISFFIDPLLCHRIYRDFLIPNSICSSSKDPIYHFKSFLSYKSLSQVHLREDGVALQFNDVLPGYITPLPLLQKRLDSAGNAHLHELAEYLPMYYEFFEKGCNDGEEISFNKDESEPLLSSSCSSSILLQEIDKIFKDFPEDFLFITVYKTYKGADDRLQMIAFNRNLISLLTQDSNFESVFENEFIEQLLEIFKDFSMDHYMEDFVAFVKKFPIRELHEQLNPKTDYYITEIQTIIGLVKVQLEMRNLPLEINGVKYHVVTSIIEQCDRNSLYPTLKDRKKHALDTKKINNDKDWAKLFQFYYHQASKKTK